MVHVQWVGALERYRSPRSEGLAQRERALVVGVDQGARLPAREPLDSQGAREAQQRSVEPIERDERGAPVAILRIQVDHVWPLAGEVQDGEAALTPHEGELAALGERLHERLGPEVQVNVDPHSCLQPFRDIGWFVDPLYGD